MNRSASHCAVENEGEAAADEVRVAASLVASPWLSIVIPTHDTRDLTLSCVASLGEPAAGVEVLVVDDASADGTAEAIAEIYPSVRVLRRQKRGGFAAAANQGLKAARGELLLLLNSDAEIDQGALDGLRQSFAERPKLGIAGGLLRYPDGRPQWSGGGEPTLLWLFALSSGLGALLGSQPLYRRLRPVGGHDRPVTWVTGTAMVIRRTTLAEVGPMDEGFATYCQDLDFCSRARRRGWSAEVLSELGVVHHHGATIGNGNGIAAHQDLALLWIDLLRWTRKHRDERIARRAARALRWGVRLRLGGRRLTGILLRSEARRAWDRDSEVLHRALAELDVPPAN